MDFELSEDQTLLCDSVDRYLRDAYTFARRRTWVAAPEGYSEACWQAFAEMGWRALPFAEANGGLGGSIVDVMLLTGKFGKHLVCEPFLPSILLAGRLIEELGSTAQRNRLLPQLASGGTVATVAFAEPQAPYEPCHVATSATVAGAPGLFRLSGHKSVVLHAQNAAQLLVVARLRGDVREMAGVAVFVVDADAEGLDRVDFRLADGTPASDIWLNQVLAKRLGEGEAPALGVLRRVLDEATSAICADLVGAMGAVFDLTRSYAATRRQFGRAIGDNQVVQHRLVDMHGALEEAGAVTEMMAMRLAEGHDGASGAVAGAAARVLDRMRFVGEQAIQLHGGVGMTDDLPVGHFYKRLLVLEGVFGSASHHLDRFAGVVENGAGAPA